MENLKKTDLLFGKWHEEFDKFFQNCYFHGILLSKVENAWATTYRGVTSNDTEEWWKIWRGIDLLFQNWHKEFDEFWLENSKVSKIYTLMGCIWPKYIMCDLKRYRGIISGSTEYWCKIWRKTDLWFGTWHEWRIGQIFTRAHRILKIGTFIGSFYTKWKMYELKT